MEPLSLDAILDGAIPATQAREAGWRQFGFLHNPYPSRSHPIWDVFYNQAEVRRRFYDDLGEFLRESSTVTLFFTGGNRVGKTHFMEYHRKELTAKLAEREIVVPIAVLSSQSSDFRSLYSQLMEQIDENLRIQSGYRLFEAPIAGEVVAKIPGLPPGDFRRALQNVTASDSEELRLIFRRWLRGDRIRAPQRSMLGVASIVDSLSQMLNAIEGLVKFLLLPEELEIENGIQRDERLSQCRGILVFLDEFELVWRARRDRRDQFLQALRAMIDACPNGLFLCVGMATGMGVEEENVEASYPALFQRLKGAREIPALVQIGYVYEAIAYTREFEKFARIEFHKQFPGETGYKDLFTDQEIEAFFKLAGRGGSASQGDFFDQLHTEAERRFKETDQDL
jgi:hypothetical protein